MRRAADAEPGDPSEPRLNHGVIDTESGAVILRV